MRKIEKQKLHQRTSIREHLPRLNSTSDAPVKLILIIFYLLGGILVWWNQQNIAAAAGNIDYISPVAVYAMQDSGKCEYHITTPKSKSGIRIVPMLSEVKKALLAEKKRQMQEGFNQMEIDGYSGFIFQNRFGECLNPHAINRAIERISREYNKAETEQAKKENRQPELLPHFSAHNLRHTFCTRFCENETNLKVIQEIMGHADIATTMNIYNEATKAKKQESFSNLEGKIKIS